MPRMRVWLWNTLHRLFPTSAADAYCSFCGRSHKDAGPFVEGVVGSMICGQCIRTSADILAKVNATGDLPNEALVRPKSFDHHGFMNRVLLVNLVVFLIAVLAGLVWFAFVSI